MESFVKKIFDDKIDEFVHLQFEKYGRGEYRDKAMILAKKTKGIYTISTSPEFASELVRMVAEKLGGQKTEVTGIVVSTRDLTGELKFKDKKQFMGVKKYIINDEMSGPEIIGLCDKFPRAFLGLSFKSGNNDLKIKAKMPKSGKPSTKSDEKPKVDFCKLKTDDSDLVRKILFDVKEFKAVQVKHTFIINEIIVPKGEPDPRKMREMAQRKGKIVRETNVDGLAVKEEKEFSA
ncbi:hypothetical protein CO038_04090 [Candidatus Pacearchaeota archaeon CG_4_9_14_0_2_um_filter_39_13]|nr:hypothetical protein [Candidatus Pacearchaeota archaeon]OIO44075.1 MAG: hypothetical protein AUJ64_00445 [Candidatus Pacearchaeota archaeon CG1_02_39_14]PJC44365.1 MAG: hypothetical protein CO038_04090 [Candidatus Pacearchaeota archaeon CG_4_9_14_0_2_um_filter_39_13]